MKRKTHFQSLTHGAGFTILEVMLGVAIIALITISIFGFVGGNLKAISSSQATVKRDDELMNFVRVLKTQIEDPERGQQQSLLGTPHKLGTLPSDEIQWLTSGGAGLFTDHGDGFYFVTLALRAPAITSNTLQLGVLRVLRGDPSGNATFYPVLDGIRGIEFRYYSTQQSSWSDGWQDAGSLPSLVRMRLWRDSDGDDAPLEYMFRLPPGAGQAPIAMMDRRGAGPTTTGTRPPGLFGRPPQNGGPPGVGGQGRPGRQDGNGRGPNDHGGPATGRGGQGRQGGQTGRGANRGPQLPFGP